MKTSELSYDLPHELIAQRPCDNRDEARLLVLNRATRAVHADVFKNVANYLAPGDCLVLNDTQVVQARLQGKKSTGGKVEIFLLREFAPGEWDALVRSSRRVRPGTHVRLQASLRAIVQEVLPRGHRRVTFENPDVLNILEQAGEVPLPPYIHRDHPTEMDRERYQTVYARHPGAVAAPTAGLHFTEEVFNSLARTEIHRAFLTLHVGYGTFRPIKTETLEEHRMDTEEFDLPPETASVLNETRNRGGRVVAVGTTCARVLETQCAHGSYTPGRGFTDCYIYPPYAFRAVDVLLTNFHLPRSSLLALVCAFADTQMVLNAYRLAVEQRFRFYSYGDAMLIL
jgi:S-adenosylmethionine:tRNA ribosyltransferase-isomerase